jgi:DNA polymerase-3 subunit alpha
MNKVIEKPTPPKIEPWSTIQQLKHEKNYLGFFLTGHPLDKYKHEILAFTTCTIPEIENYKNKEIKIAGIVTDFQEKTSQKGTKWGKVLIEDFQGSIEISLFGEDFLKFKHFFVIDNMLFLTCGYVPNYKNPEIFDIKIKDIKLLEDLTESVKEIIIEIDLDNFFIDNQRIKTLKEIFHRHKGGKNVKFAFCSDSVIELLTLSKNTQVHINYSLFMELEHHDFKFKLK